MLKINFKEKVEYEEILKYLSKKDLIRLIRSRDKQINELDRKIRELEGRLGY